ncbi:hypothetical protein PV325_006780 [Microctonus aethiopoides]|nr:hypothetical protein PV325_006780 [Microctonus aethiopoides]
MKELSLRIEERGYHLLTDCRIQITWAGATGIKNMKNLWKLELYGFSFKADKLKLIVWNESITHLSLENCSFEKCINLVANFRGLKYLNLSSVVAVNNDFLIKLAENCTELEELNIEYCSDVTNNGINAVFKLKKLTTLIINELHEVTDTVLQEINLSGTSISTRFLDAAYNVAISRANAIPLKVFVSHSIKLNWTTPPCISESVLIVEGENDIIQYLFEDMTRLSDFFDFYNNDDDDDDDDDEDEDEDDDDDDDDDEDSN